MDKMEGKERTGEGGKGGEKGKGGKERKSAHPQVVESRGLCMV